jgi:hypothetical protein
MGERIASYCPRINLLKLYGPVIDEQRARGLTPLVVVPGPGLITYGAKNRALAAGRFLDDLRRQLGPEVEVAVVDSPAAFLDTLMSRRVRAVVHVGVRLPRAIVEQVQRPSRQRGVRWCSLGYIHEELLQLIEDGVGALDDWDVLTTLSADALNATVRLLKERNVPDASKASRLVPIGFVELDQVRGFDRTALRRKHGIPVDEPVIYFATAARPRLRARGLAAAYFGAVHPRLRVGGLAHRLWGRRYPDFEYLATYHDIVACVHRFARRHGARLIAKTRAKHQDPPFVRRYVDALVPDGEFYPFVTLELIHLADLYVGLPTASALEAAFVGRRMVHVMPHPLEVYESAAFLPLRREFYDKPGGLWRTPGLAERFLTYRREGWEGLRAWADEGDFVTTVDPEARRTVVRRVIGFDDTKASARFLDLVETSLGEEGR